MANNIIEAMESALIELNRQIADKEQQGAAAKEFFQTHLSDQLIFRRASGKVVRKEDFLEGLKNNQFKTRDPEDISVTLQGDRALVTLVIRTTKENSPEQRFRNIRLFSRSGDNWIVELWYNYEITGL